MKRAAPKAPEAEPAPKRAQQQPSKTVLQPEARVTRSRGKLAQADITATYTTTIKEVPSSQVAISVECAGTDATACEAPPTAVPTPRTPLVVPSASPLLPAAAAAAAAQVQLDPEDALLDLIDMLPRVDQEESSSTFELHADNIIQRYNTFHGGVTPDVASIGHSMLAEPVRYVLAMDAAMWPGNEEQRLFGDFLTTVWGLAAQEPRELRALGGPSLRAFVKVKGLSLMTMVEGCTALPVERACLEAHREALDLVALIKEHLGCA
jgi:hypothetical protein